MAVGPVLTLGLGAFTGGGVKYLPTLGYGTAAAASVDTGGYRRRRSRRREREEQEEAEIQMILQQVIPLLRKGGRGRVR